MMITFPLSAKPFSANSRHRSFVRIFASFSIIATMLVFLVACDMQDEEEPTEKTYVWETIQSVNVPSERHENAYVVVGDKFYLLGGRGQRSVEVYDPTTKTWETRSAPPFQMHHFQAVPYNGQSYIMGAFTDGFPDEPPIPNIYIYDPATDQWTEGPEIPEGRRRGAAGAVVYNNKFYIVCGIQNGHMDGYVSWLDSYDPQSGTWTQLADAPRARDHFQAVVLDGKLYAAAGRRSSFATGQTAELTEKAVDVYDFSTNSWSTLVESANLPTERAGTAAVAFDDKVLVLGGESVRQLPGEPQSPPPAHSEVEAYNPGTGAWETLAPMIEGRHGTQAIVHNGMIYIAAGSRTLGSNEINSHEVYRETDSDQ